MQMICSNQQKGLEKGGLSPLSQRMVPLTSSSAILSQNVRKVTHNHLIIVIQHIRDLNEDARRFIVFLQGHLQSSGPKSVLIIYEVSRMKK